MYLSEADNSILYIRNSIINAVQRLYLCLSSLLPPPLECENSMEFRFYLEFYKSNDMYTDARITGQSRTQVLKCSGASRVKARASAAGAPPPSTSPTRTLLAHQPSVPLPLQQPPSLRRRPPRLQRRVRGPRIDGELSHTERQYSRAWALGVVSISGVLRPAIHTLFCLSAS